MKFSRKTLCGKLLAFSLVLFSLNVLEAGGDDKEDGVPDTSFVELSLQSGNSAFSRTANGDDSVKISGFGWYQSPGNPRLPSKILNVILPPTADLASVSVKLINTFATDVDGQHDICPCPPYAAQQEGSKPEWGKDKNIVNGRNTLVYSVGSKYPSSPVKLIHVGQYGELKYAKIKFMPLQYNAVSKKLSLNSNVKCRILFTVDEKTTVSSKALKRLNQPMTQKVFTNANEALSWYEPSQSPFGGGGTALNAGDNTGYIIVTTDAIASTGVLDSFISHKEDEGWTVTVITESDYGSATGQEKCDNIRQWLVDNYENHNVKYVLLVGDPRVNSNGIPMKKTYPRDDPTYLYVPSDYYYADLTGNWDLDNDGRYGEFEGDRGPGGVDFAAEVIVGRIPVYSSTGGTTLQAILDKIENYESSPTTENGWRKNVLLPMSFSDLSTDGAYLAQEMVDSYIIANCFDYYRMYQQGGYYSSLDSTFNVPTNCEQELRAGYITDTNSVLYHWAGHTDGYGIVAWWGHGNAPGAYAGMSGHWDPQGEGPGAFMHSTYVDSLSTTKPAFTMQISCTNAAPGSTDNLAYSLLKGSAGAIATLAGTDVTYYYVGQQSFDNTTSNAGIAFEYVERLITDMPCGDCYFESVASLSPEDEIDWWNFMCFAIYGDPSCHLNAPGPSITTRSLNSCEEDGTYSIFLQASNGVEPYTWSIVSGNLPSGLTLDENTGEIYGTPDTAGKYEFALRVTDDNGDKGQKVLSIQIYAVETGFAEPESFAGEAASTSSVTWTWTEPSGDFEGYIIYTSDHSLMYTIAKGTTTLVETGLTPNMLVTRQVHSFGPLVSLYTDTFSTNKGWSKSTGANKWQILVAASGGGSQGGNPDPDYTPSGGDNKLMGYEIGGDYSKNLNQAVHFSPEIDCSTASKVTLRFQRWLNVEKSEFDLAEIYVRPNGSSSWSCYWTNPEGTDLTDSSWHLQEFNVSKSAAGGSNVEIAFTMGDTDSGLELSGWNIDDLELIGRIDSVSQGTTYSIYTHAAVPGTITFETGSIVVSWNPNGNPDGTMYELQRRYNSNPFETVYSNTTPSYTDADVTEDTTYYYRVKAINGDDVSTAWTDESPIEYSPSAVILRSFTAHGYDGEVLVEWETGAEFENIGFNIYRSEDKSGTPERINTYLICGKGSSAFGGRYCFLDRSVTNGKTYYYFLEDMDYSGKATRHGPVSVIPTVETDKCDFDPSNYISWATSSGEYQNVTSSVEPAGSSDFTEESMLDGSPFVISRNSRPTESDIKAGTTCRIIEQTDSSMMIQVMVPKPVFGTSVKGKQSFDTIHIPGFSTIKKPARPELPSRGYLIVLPEEVLAASSSLIYDISEEYDGIKLYIPGKSRTGKLPLPQNIGSKKSKLLGGELVLTEAYSREHANSASTNTDWEEYPDGICSIGKIVRIGKQKYGVLTITPDIYDRIQNKITHHKELVVKVKFRTSSSKRTKKYRHGEVLSTQWDLAASNALKIGVVKDGIYRISVAELLAAGLDPSCQIQDLKLFESGRQVAIAFEKNSRGKLDPEDHIIFYGRKKSTLYSDQNTYWLVGTRAESLRMRTCKGKPKGNTSSVCRSFRATSHFEENKIYWFSSLEEGTDHWLWSAIVAPQAEHFEFDLSGVDNRGDDAILRIHLQGVTQADTVSPDHAVNISVNGILLGKIAFDGQSDRVETIRFPQNVLREGSNILTVEVLSVEGAPINMVALNSFDVTYRRRLVAKKDMLAFTISRGVSCMVDGFSNNDILIFDLTSPVRPARIRGFKKSGNKEISVRFDLCKKARGTRKFVVLTRDKCLSPASIEKNKISNLHSGSNAADYIVITHNNFEREANLLANYRQSHGLRTIVVDVEDIYDEFSYGNTDAQAIKEFVKRAYESWQAPSAKYVVLIGDGSSDYKDNFGFGDRNFVPAYLVETSYVQTASDNYYVCVSGEDNLPDLYIGRLPASSSSEARVMVDKIINYESSATGGNWEKRALFVADNVNSVFIQIADRLADLLNADYTAQKVYLSQLTLPEVRERTLSSLDAGSLVTVFVGHGYTDIWAAEPILSNADVNRLKNGHRLPFIVALTCFNGFFSFPYGESIAEQFIRHPGGGAVAYWGSSGVSMPLKQKLLAENLFTSIFKKGHRCLGEATTQAKLLLAGDSDFSTLLETWVLFGDPAMKLK